MNARETLEMQAHLYNYGDDIAIHLRAVDALLIDAVKLTFPHSMPHTFDNCETCEWFKRAKALVYSPEAPRD